MRVLRVVALALLMAGCSSAAAHRSTSGSRPQTSPSVTTRSVPPAGSPAAASGVRTVLSPVGLNIRAQPAKTAAVVRTAAQGAVLTVVGQTAEAGGWYQVKGSTVTGWISSDPSLSAPGQFHSYTSSQHQLSVLYPADWTFADSPPASVVFRPPAGRDSVVGSAAPSVDGLGRGRPGYRRTNSQQVIVCGVTGTMNSYVQSGPPVTSPQPAGVVSEHYLVQLRLPIDAQHALGLDGNFADQSQLPTFRNFVNSLTFPSPLCRSAAA
jgi:hypothetical protein